MLLQVDHGKYQDLHCVQWAVSYRANSRLARLLIGPKDEYEWCGDVLWMKCHSMSAWAHCVDILIRKICVWSCSSAVTPAADDYG